MPGTAHRTFPLFGLIACVFLLLSCATQERLPEIPAARLPISKSQRAFRPARAHLLSTADISITLNNDFIQDLASRIQVQVDYNVVHAMRTPHSAASDGDTHNSGTSPEVRLPIVAEVMNAAEQPAVKVALINAEQNQTAVTMSGVWRIWCEHAVADQVQGNDGLNPDNTNPDHVFEIHPITGVGSLSLTQSLHPIQGYQPKDARTAFSKYNSGTITITRTATTVSFGTQSIKENYVEFRLKPIGEQNQSLAGGTAVYATIETVDGAILIPKCRTLFVAGSQPDQALGSVQPGATLHVLGIPRIDMGAVWGAAQTIAEGGSPKTYNLPYEIVVVGLYQE